MSDECAMPQLERQQEVQMAPVLSLPFAVAMQQCCDVVLGKVTPTRGVARQEMLVEEWAHLVAHPVLDWIGEPLLLAPHDGSRQPAFHCAFVQVLAVPASKLIMT